MKTLVEALRRNADAFDAPRRDLANAENSAFRCKFASAFGPRPAGTPQNGENRQDKPKPPQDKPKPPQDKPKPPQDKPEPPQDKPKPPQDKPKPPKRKTARGKGGKR